MKRAAAWMIAITPLFAGVGCATGSVTDATAAQKEFSQLKACPVERVKVTSRDSPPAEIANDPARLAMWRQSRGREGVTRFTAEGCGSDLRLNCHWESVPGRFLSSGWNCRSAGPQVSAGRLGSQFPAYAENCALEFPEGGMSKIA